MTRAPNRLRELRQAAGLSLEALASQVGATKSQVQRLEVGDTGLDVEWMRRLGKVLGVPPSAFLIDEDAEFRIGPAERGLKAALEPYGVEERQMIMRAATEIAKLVRRVAPQQNAVRLDGEPSDAAMLADIWNDMNGEQRHRTLEFIRAAAAFSRPAAA